MQIRPTYSVELTEEEKAEARNAEEEARVFRAEAAAKREAEEAKANGDMVSLSEKSIAALIAIDDQRLRRNIQWGIVRGMFLYSLFMIPVVFIVAIIISASR